MAEADQPRTIRFGLFEVDLRTGELCKNGVKIKLQEQPFRVLVTLLRHAGEVVTRDELRLELWPADTFVDFEHGLNAAIKRLRGALGESAENPIFIETLARRGYRFNAPVANCAAPRAVQPGSQLARSTQAPRRPHPLGQLGTPVAIVALVAALSWLGSYWGRIGAAGKPIESLAVLPLENLSRDPDQEYFSDGMTDALITQLSKVGTLRVASHTSVMRYKGMHKSLPEIAKELNVDGVIEGSVMRSGNQVRIAAQLVQARTDKNLWAETYERDLGDVLRLQSEVAQAVAQRVQMRVTPAQKNQFHPAPAVDAQAYEAYLKGSFYLQGNKASLKHAQAYFEEAVSKDPGFARAYVGLAESYAQLGSYRCIAPQEAYRQGSEAIHKALQLDEALGEAHTSLGYLEWRYAWDWEAAEKELRYAVELNPNSIDGHESLLWYLAWTGRRDQALAEADKIRRLDPVYPILPLEAAGVYYHQRDYNSLVEASRTSVATFPVCWSSHYFLAVGYEGTSRFAQALAEYQQAVELSQGDSDATAGLAHLYATMGRVAEADSC